MRTTHHSAKAPQLRARVRRGRAASKRIRCDQSRRLCLEPLEQRALLTLAAYIVGPGDPWNSQSNDQALNVAFGSDNWDKVSYASAISSGVFDPGRYDLVFVDGGDGQQYNFTNFVNANRGLLETWVGSGGSLFLNAARWDHPVLSLGFGATLIGGSSTNANAVNLNHPILNGPQFPTGTSWSGNSFSHDYISGSGLTSIIVDQSLRPVLTEKAWGKGHVLFGGMTPPHFHSPQPHATNLRVNTLAYAASKANWNMPPEIVGVSLDRSQLLENDTVILAAAFTDLNALDTHSVLIDWGDGHSTRIDLIDNERDFEATHQYLDDGSSGVASVAYAISVTVADHLGASNTFAGLVQTELIVNGGFETGDFTGWTVFNSGNGGWAINNGSFVPPGPGEALPPMSGHFDAVSFQNGSGVHILSEAIVVPSHVDSATLGWSDRIRNYAEAFSEPHQEWRVSILDGGGNKIREVFSTNPGDPLQQIGPNHRSYDVTSLLQSLTNQTIRLSFEQQDNLGFFNATLDNVSLKIGVHEPLEVSVRNVVPAFDAGSNETIAAQAAGAFSRTIDFIDPGTLDIHTVAIDYGDGNSEEFTLPVGDRSFTLNHTFTTEGTFTVKVTVDDDDLGTFTDSLLLTVELNTPPIADAGGPYEIVEGDSLTVDASASYDPDDDALSLLWDISGDGSFNDAAGVTVALSWAQLVGLGIDDGGTYTLTVRVDDGRGGVSYATQTLTVLNTPPTLTISGPAQINEGSVYTLNLSSSDPGNDTITQWTIDWGDGTVETTPGNPSSVIHVYADGTRNHTIRASATDEDGTWDAPPVGSNAMVSLDPTFGDGGRVTTDFFDSTSDFVQDAALVQPDGKIVLAGYKSAGVTDLVLARYTAAGLLDDTFGTNGVVITDFGITEYPYALTQDAAGRLLVGGNFGLLRFEAAGTLDATFGSNGRITSFGTTIQSIALDSQGRIVVGGGNRVGRFNADGILDGSFNVNGLRTNLTVPGTSTYFGVISLTIDGQDRIILGGYASLFNVEANRITDDFVVVRLDEHGAVDSTFADGGKYVADFGGPGYWSHDYVRDLAIDSQGRIIAAGSSSRYNPDSTPPNQYLGERAALVRIDADGVADESFNTNARAAVEPWSGWDARGVAIDSDDKLLFTNHSGVVRLTADGAADTTFGSGGRTTNPHGVWNSQTILLAEQDGSYDILRTGYRSGPGIEGANLGVVRYGYSGNLDTSFAGGVGYISTDFQGSTADYVRAITVTQPDGKVVVAGYKSGGTTEMVLARYLADGTADPTFAGDGILLSGRSGPPTALAIDASGGLVVALYNLVYRYQSDGTEDLGFGLSGQNYANTSLNSIPSLLIDAQGGILAGGYTWRQHPGSGEYGNEFGITRLSGAGQLDTMFGVNGTAVVDFGGIAGARNQNILQAMTFDENGRIVAAGYAEKYNVTTGQSVENSRHALARFSSDGSVDAAFGTNGTVLTDFGTGHYSASSVAIDSDGRILAGGNSHLARYLADGTLDSSFGTAGTGKVLTTGSFRAIVVDANHRIILGGSNNLLRYTASGTPDTDFAPNGRFVLADSSIHTVILDASDRILIAGSTLSTSPTGADFLVARYLTTGLAVTVLNVAPQNLAISGPSTTPEGSTIQLAGSATDPGIYDQLSYTWTITRNGNAYAEAAGETISFAAHDGGTYVATMRVDDGDGGVSTRNHAIIVANVAPTAAFNAPDEVDEGTQCTVSLTDPYDPSSVDTAAGFSYAFNFGLGFGAYSSSNTASFTPPDSGDLVVSARIRDKDGGVTEYTTTVAVENVAPIATLWDDGPVTYGELVTVGFSDPSDPSPVDTAAGFHYSFGLELADLAETYSAAGPSPSSSIGMAAGTHIVYGRIFDKDDGYSDYTTTVVVAKAQLTVTADDWTKVYDGSPVESFTVSYSGFVAGDDHEVLDGELVLGGPAVGAIDAGTYAITTGGFSSTNYDITFETGTLTIDKADATVVVEGYTGVYDGNAHGASGSATGVNGESLSGLDLGASFTNVLGGTANWVFTDATGNYNDASGSVEIVINKADTTVSVTGYSGGVYDGTAHTRTVAVTGVVSDGELYTTNLTGTNAGGYNLPWSYSNGNYNDVSGTLEFVIAKADATVDVSGTTVTYDGHAHGASGSATGVNGESLSGLDLGASFTNAPGGTANWVFTDATGNYHDASGSVEIVINKADATIDVSGTTVTYDGNVHGASGSATGVNGEPLSGLDLGASFANAPGGTANWVFTDATGNYNDASGSVAIVISKADATVSVTGFSGGVYDGTAHTRTVAVTGVVSDGELYTASLTGTNSGGYNLPWSYSNGNYHDVSGTLEFVIAKADASIVVSGTTVTYDGTAHGASGSATGVNGEPLAGLDLGASFTNAPGGTANWVFTDATGNYHDASGTVAIVIDKADQYLTWDQPVSILYGTALSEEQLNASVQVVGPAEPGALNYAPDLGTILAVGVHTLTVTAPATENYNEASLSVELKVLKPYSISGIVFVDFNNDGEVNFGEMGIAEVLITLTGTDDLGQEIDQDIWTDEDGFYKFENLRPGSYHVTQSQPEGYLQGINSEGTLDGQLSAVDQFFLQLGAEVLDASVTTDAMDYNFGERPPAEAGIEAGQTASIGFWQNKNGQALIQSLNGGAQATQLGDWLAATLPNMFGALEGKSNTQVGQHFRMLFAIRGQKLEAQVMATALAVYITNESLAGTAGQGYGFTVTEYGVGNRTYDVGTNGAAFGAENHTVMTVLDLLLATDGMTVGGILYCNEDAGLMKLLRNMANEVYDDINN